MKVYGVWNDVKKQLLFFPDDTAATVWFGLVAEEKSEIIVFEAEVIAS